MKKNFAYWIYILLGFSSWLMTRYFRSNPDQCESLYTNAVYSWIRLLYDSSIGRLNIPFVYIVLILIILVIAKKLLRRRTRPFSIWRFIMKLVAYIALIYFLFQLLWGFNYQNTTLKKKWELQVTHEFQDSILIKHLEQVVASMEYSREAIGMDDQSSFEYSFNSKTLENQLREELRTILKSNDLYAGGNIRIRALKPNGTLLSFSTAGIYFPFAFEGHIDAGLHPLQFPFTMAHEMAQGFAITDEGECNFLALLACVNSEDPFIRYSGQFSYFRYLASNVRLVLPDQYEEIRNNYPAFIKRDLQAVRTQMNKYPDYLPKLRNWLYNNYLTAQGVHAGLKSYSEIVSMTLAWEAKRGTLF